MKKGKVKWLTLAAALATVVASVVAPEFVPVVPVLLEALAGPQAVGL